jgi:hypothetical protein
MRGGDEFNGWGFQRYQLQSLIDAVNYNTYAVVAVNSGKRKPKPPEENYRPKEKSRKKPKSNNVFAQRLMAARRAKAAKS